MFIYIDSRLNLKHMKHVPDAS